MNKFTEIENLLEWAGYNPFMFQEKNYTQLLYICNPIMTLQGNK